MGDKKTMQLLKMASIPISPALRVFTKKGSAANDITLDIVPVTVYIPTCLKESFSKIDLMLGNKILSFFWLQ